MNKKTLLVIEGPTASGKTALAVQLAKQLNAPVISSDSRQFYKELHIGTAKPSMTERQGVPHYFIDSHHLENPITAARFEAEAMDLLNDLFQNHTTVILTGGSGLFTDAVCEGLDPIPKDDKIKNELIELEKRKGLSFLLNELKEKDPIYFDQVDRNNPSRVIRAIEAIRITGKPYSSLRSQTIKKRNFQILRFLIDIPRNILYDRINTRVDLMMKAGLLDEVKSVYHLRHLQALKTVGYQELFEYLDGKITLDQAVELIKQHTRNYAKRQYTWFRRHPESHLIAFDTTDKMSNHVCYITDNVIPH